MLVISRLLSDEMIAAEGRKIGSRRDSLGVHYEAQSGVFMPVVSKNNRVIVIVVLWAALLASVATAQETTLPHPLEPSDTSTPAATLNSLIDSCNRLHQLIKAGPITDRPLQALLHSKIRKVTEDIAAFRYNTAIAALMELLNGLISGKEHYRECIRALLQMICPFAPFAAHELWEQLGGKEMIDTIPWPSFDEVLIQRDMIPFVIQVDGRVRDKIMVPANRTESELEQDVLASNRVRSAIGRKSVVRSVFVPGRLLNLVTANREVPPS